MGVGVRGLFSYTGSLTLGLIWFNLGDNLEILVM